jgi:hypothetical protein
MEELRPKAFRIYLQHALSSALTVESVVTLRKSYLDNHTVQASATWARYCRNAQSVCGVFGLAAVDRAESSLRSRLLSDSCFESTGRSANADLAQKLEASARCYIRALICQATADSTNAALWSYCGAVYDQVRYEKFSLSRQYRSTVVHDLDRWKVVANSTRLRADTRAAEFCCAEITELRDEIAMKYRTALARMEVAIAQHSLPKALAVENCSAIAFAAASSARPLERSLEYIQQAVVCDTTGEDKLQALWRLCVGHMRHAAEEISNLNTSRAAMWERSGHKLADLAHKLAKLVSHLSEVSRTAPCADISRMELQLSQVFQHINESALVRDPASDAARTFDAAAIVGDIEGIMATLLTIAPRTVPEQKIVQRYVVAANQVNVEQSPAHPHIKHCWRNAAEQMRLAIVSANEKDIGLHKLRSSLYEKIAHGPLATAADYFTKAALAPTVQTKGLWLEAAETLLEAAVALTERCFALKKDDQLYYSRGESAVVLRSQHLAEAAACGQRANTHQTATVHGPLSRLHEAELQLRLAVLAWDAALGKLLAWHLHKFRELCTTLLNWCEQRSKHVASLVLPGAPPVSAKQQLEMQHSTVQRLERGTWLCGVLTFLVCMYTTAAQSSAVVRQVNLAIPVLDTLVNKLVEEIEISCDDSQWRPLIGAVQEAAIAFLSDSVDECLLWRAAAHYVGELQHCPVGKRIYNRLVVKAWELRGTERADAVLDPLLLLPIPTEQNALVDAQYIAHIDEATDALVESQRQRELSEAIGFASAGALSAIMSATQYHQGAHYVRVGLGGILKGDEAKTASEAEMTAYLEQGERAMLAGQWYAAAPQAAPAAAAGQWEVRCAFMKAASYVQQPLVHPTADDDNEDMVEYYEPRAPIAQSTGERFARAGTALLAGDRELYEMWLKAAEVTERALARVSWQGDAHTIQSAKNLAQAAQQRQDAAPARTTSAAVEHGGHDVGGQV